MDIEEFIRERSPFMNVEQIVRALAAMPPPLDSEYGTCGLCGIDPRHENNVRVGAKPGMDWWEVAALPGVITDYEDARLNQLADVHEPHCPWRLAREWVAHR